MKLLRVLFQNLGVLAVFLAAFLAYGWWRSDPEIVDRRIPVHYPEEPMRGSLSEPVSSRGVTLTVSDVTRAPSRTAAGDLELSSRARVDDLTDFVTLRLTVTNGGSEPVSLDYYGSGQRADLFLGARKPSTSASLPLLPNDVLRLGGEPLPARVLEPGETVEGLLVYPVNRRSSDLALAVLPARHFSASGHSLPSFEIDLGEIAAR